MKGYIPTLDGWRAVAILGVLFFHGFHHELDGGGHPRARLVCAAGAKGVNVFFAISGFLICCRLLQEHEEQGRISLKGFYVRRASRILPPVFCYLAALALLATVGLAKTTKSEIIACLFFYRNYCSGPYTTAHFWSLSLEEQFYLFFPLFLIVQGPRRALYSVAVLALCVITWQFLDQHYHITGPGGMRAHNTDLWADALLWGCWAALLVQRLKCRQFVQRYLTTWLWLLLLVFVVLSATFQPWVGSFVQAAAIPWLLLGTVLRPSAIVSRILEQPLLRWIGRLSYSLYIWQQLFCRLYGDTTFPSPCRVLQQPPLNICMTFLCAMMSYYWLERPLVRLGHRLSKRYVLSVRESPSLVLSPR